MCGSPVLPASRVQDTAVSKAAYMLRVSLSVKHDPKTMTDKRFNGSPHEDPSHFKALKLPEPGWGVGVGAC